MLYNRHSLPVVSSVKSIKKEKSLQAGNSTLYNIGTTGVEKAGYFWVSIYFAETQETRPPRGIARLYRHCDNLATVMQSRNSVASW